MLPAADCPMLLRVRHAKRGKNAFSKVSASARVNAPPRANISAEHENLATE
jgi:hypothetical protein